MKSSVSILFRRVCCIVGITVCLLFGGFSVSSAAEPTNKQPGVVAAEVQDDPKKTEENDDTLNRRVSIMGLIGVVIVLAVSLIGWLIWGNGDQQEEDSPANLEE